MAMMMQQKQDTIKGQCLLKLMQFSEHLSGFPVSFCCLIALGEAGIDTAP